MFTTTEGKQLLDYAIERPGNHNTGPLRLEVWHHMRNMYLEEANKQKALNVNTINIVFVLQYKKEFNLSMLTWS